MHGSIAGSNFVCHSSAASSVAGDQYEILIASGDWGVGNYQFAYDSSTLGTPQQLLPVSFFGSSGTGAGFSQHPIGF